MLDFREVAGCARESACRGLARREEQWNKEEEASSTKNGLKSGLYGQYVCIRERDTQCIDIITDKSLETLESVGPQAPRRAIQPHVP